MEDTARSRARALLSMTIEKHILHYGLDRTLEVITCTQKVRHPQDGRDATRELSCKAKDWSSLTQSSSNVRWADLDEDSE